MTHGKSAAFFYFQLKLTAAWPLKNWSWASGFCLHTLAERIGIICSRGLAKVDRSRPCRKRCSRRKVRSFRDLGGSLCWHTTGLSDHGSSPSPVGYAFRGRCLVAGIFSRSFAIFAWFVHLCAAESGGFVSYWSRQLHDIGLLFDGISAARRYHSISRWRKLPSKNQRLSRVLSPCVASSSLSNLFFWRRSKCLGSGCGGFESLGALSGHHSTYAPEILIRLKYLFPVAGIVICLLEISYPFLFGTETEESG